MAVSERRVSVKWLTPCIEWILTADVSGKKKLLYLTCFVNVENVSGAHYSTK